MAAVTALVGRVKVRLMVPFVVAVATLTLASLCPATASSAHTWAMGSLAT